MSADHCSGCQFWKISPSDPEADAKDEFGWCRRHPPTIVDHMARQAIPPVGFGGHNFDPEDIATVGAVHNAGLFPATHGMTWCGEFAATRER